MATTGWTYFTPYQPDVEVALHALQAEVFTCGKYDRPLLDGLDNIGNALESLDDKEFRDMDETEQEALISIYHLESLRDPIAQYGLVEAHEYMKSLATTPDLTYNELRLMLDFSSSGSHSILDMYGIAPTRGALGCFYPLSEAPATELFGSAQPTREQIQEDESYARYLWYNRWEGFYVAVYRDGKPEEWCFEGCSGD